MKFSLPLSSAVASPARDAGKSSIEGSGYGRSSVVVLRRHEERCSDRPSLQCKRPRGCGWHLQTHVPRCMRNTGQERV